MGVNQVLLGAVKIMDISDATVAADKMLEGVTAYDRAGDKITGTIAEVEQATPTISVSSAGLITAAYTQRSGIVSGGTKKATRQLDVQAAKTVNPGTSNQVAVASHTYTTGEVVVGGDTNLIPENIREGVSIFGVTGTHGGGSGDSYKNAEEVYY